MPGLCACRASAFSQLRAHAKLLKQTLPPAARCSPPPYSCTRVRRLKPLLGSGVTSRVAPSAADLHAGQQQVHQHNLDTRHAAVQATDHVKERMPMVRMRALACACE
eukprot:GHRQ01026027.1.p2 GENE.GHRQ01026027.1~~GHRQ01026027.1.p2  ORF type:complete len:107 (+),score=16.08 GHRQ01026027.1:210-530(+)